MTRQRFTSALIITAIAGSVPVVTQAANPLGFYIGAGVGYSTVADNGSLAGIPDNFSAHDFGWKLVAGLRPLSLIGAEFDYIDFGNPSAISTNVGTPTYTVNASVDSKAPALFGILYLPLPLPQIDVYAKAGLARLQTNASLYVVPCVACSSQSSETANYFAYGAGVQFRVTSFALRAEYVAVDASGGNRALLSLDGILSF